MFSKAKPCKSGSCFKVQIFLFWFKAAFLDTLQAGLACWRRDTSHGVADTYLGEIKKLFVSVMQNSQSQSNVVWIREIIRRDWNKPYTIFANIGKFIIFNSTCVQIFLKIETLRTFGEISVQPHKSIMHIAISYAFTWMESKQLCIINGA